MALFLMTDVGTHQGTDSSRVNVGHVGKIEDQVTRSVGTNDRLELKQCGQREWPRQAQDALASLRLYLRPAQQKVRGRLRTGFLHRTWRVSWARRFRSGNP